VMTKTAAKLQFVYNLAALLIVAGWQLTIIDLLITKYTVSTKKRPPKHV